MTKQKKIPLSAAAFSLALLFLPFSTMPGLAQSRTANAGDPDTLFNCTWTAAQVYPAAVLDEAVTAVGGNLYGFGGVVGGTTSAASNKFDGTTWTAIAPLPAALEYPAAVTDGTNAYIVNGVDGTGNSQPTLYRYNVGTNTYTTLAPSPVGTWNHAAVFLNGKIYKIAGATSSAGTSTGSNALNIYDIATDTWTTGANYPAALGFIGAFAKGNFIYAAGGIDFATSAPTAKTYRYDPGTNTWDDASVADLPATRWAPAYGTYTDGILAGGYVGGAATANISNTVISYDLPSNSWQPVPNMLGERARMNGAVFNNSFYVIGGRSVASPAFAGTNDNQKLTCLNTPTNILTNGGNSIVNAGANGVLDPGETVTVSLGVINSGGPGVVCTTSALTGTVQTSGGVTSPSAPQNYGALCSGSPGAFRSFTFTVDPALACGSTVTVSLVLMDGATNYGTLTYTFVTGNSAVSFSENFDGVVAPALPAGWTSAATGAEVPWVTSTVTPDTAPNDAFAPDPTTVGNTELITPVLSVGANSKLTFRNLYNMEATYDGMVLEISLDGGTTYADILAAGGSFVSGGYNGPISTAFMSPIGGRQAWSGLSGGTSTAPAYITTVVNMPAGANVRLKWRAATDSSVAAAGAAGVRIDSIKISSPVCNSTAPVPSSAVSRKIHGGAGPFDINLPLVPLTGAIGIEDRVGPNYQIVVTFPSPVSVDSVAVTTGTGSATFTVAGNVVTIDLTGVTDAQRLGVTLMNVSSGTSLGNILIPMGVLSGDTNASGSVSAADVSQTKGQSGNTTTAANFRTDVNASGSISAADVALVKSRSGTLLP